MANKIHIVQAGLVLCNFFLNDFTVTQGENLHHFSNIYDPLLHLSYTEG